MNMCSWLESSKEEAMVGTKKHTPPDVENAPELFLFFCNQFQKKDQEERKTIQQKLMNLCIMCWLERSPTPMPCEELS